MKRLRIIQDTDALNPRTDYDNAGRMLCWHSRYNLGDDHSYDADTWKEQLACEADPSLEDKLDYLRDEVAEVLYECLVDDGNHDYRSATDWIGDRIEDQCNELIDRAFDAGYVALPLYLYDHSGITMNTGGFSCGWDSGCVGVIVCDAKTVKKEWDGDRDAAERCLRAEVEVYDHYLTGNCWGFIAEEFDGEQWEEVDSCWGFLGYPEDVKSDLGDDWKEFEAEVEYA